MTIPSDGSTGNGYSRVRHQLCLGPTSILREKIKSIPRTRKEKRQNLRRCRQIQISQMHRGASCCQFHVLFYRFPMSNGLTGSHPGTISLTFLTATRQRRQTSRCMAIGLSGQCPLKTYHFTTT